MLNIEIHMPFKIEASKDCSLMLSVSGSAKKLEKEIWDRVVMNEPFAHDMVVSHHDTKCNDMLGSHRPFIRICCTNPDQGQRLVERLSGLIDIEVLLLSQFVRELPAAKAAGVHWR